MALLCLYFEHLPNNGQGKPVRKIVFYEFGIYRNILTVNHPKRNIDKEKE